MKQRIVSAEDVAQATGQSVEEIKDSWSKIANDQQKIKKNQD